jgi:hypothetical protein
MASDDVSTKKFFFFFFLFLWPEVYFMSPDCPVGCCEWGRERVAVLRHHG